MTRDPLPNGLRPAGRWRALPVSDPDDAPVTTWDRLGQPLRFLVWALIAAALVVIYNGAATVVAHLFSVCLLFVFATVVAVIVTPIVDRMQQVRPLRGHRGLAVLVLYLGIIGVIGGVAALTIPSLVEQARGVPQLVDQFQSSLDQRGIHVTLSSLAPTTGGASNLIDLATSVVAAVASVVLVVVISIYLAIEGRTLIATTRNLFGSHTKKFDFTVLAAGSTIGAYVRGQLLMCFLMGTYTALTMTVLGVHYAIVLGAAAFVLEFVPILGAVIATGLAVSVALLQSPTLAVLVLAAGLLGHALDAYIIGPRVNGRVTRLHPLVAMAALLVGAEVGGILGALFAVPVAAMANVLLGATYRSRQGQEAMSTADDGSVAVESLPRLGDEIGGVQEAGVINDPVPHAVA